MRMLNSPNIITVLFQCQYLLWKCTKDSQLQRFDDIQLKISGTPVLLIYSAHVFEGKASPQLGSEKQMETLNVKN